METVSFGAKLYGVSNQHVSTWRKDGSWWGLTSDVFDMLPLQMLACMWSACNAVVKETANAQKFIAMHFQGQKPW
jgi:hypothetical protein